LGDRYHLRWDPSFTVLIFLIFNVHYAYFLKSNDPCKLLKITLNVEINEKAWANVPSNLSRPFDKPASGGIAVKIKYLGDEVMKVSSLEQTLLILQQP